MANNKIEYRNNLNKINKELLLTKQNHNKQTIELTNKLKIKNMQLEKAKTDKEYINKKMENQD